MGKTVCILHGVIAFYLVPDVLLRNYLQVPFRTKTGMTSAAENITESLRRTRQLMVQVSSCLVFCVFLSFFFHFLLSSCTFYGLCNSFSFFLIVVILCL